MITDSKRQVASWRACLDSVVVGEARGHGGLWTYPLFGADSGAVDYRTLDDALAAGTLTIKEASAAGRVPELKAVNRGSQPVLIIDGEELVGARQNRIVNASLLVPAESTILLPVSCVEQGRWRQDSAAFRSEGTHYNARGRQKKMVEVADSLERGARPAADQGRVWRDIGAKMARMAVTSETHALHAAYQDRAAELEAFRRALCTPSDRQIGILFALGVQLIGLDLFDRAPTLQCLLPKLIGSYALDALDERPAGGPPAGDAVRTWLGRIASAEDQAHPGIGLGEDVRLRGPQVSGAALCVAGTPVHLTAFHIAPGGHSAAVSPRMARASVRRRPS